LKIFFTGASGFVGAHTALAYLEAGHDLRLLARNEQAVKKYFSDKGYALEDIVVGDMTDKALIQKHIKGCDSVYHGAAMVSLHPKHKKQVYESNIKSIDAVIGSAVESNIKNIVYVSSLGALYQKGIKEVNEHTALGNPKEAYSRSKRDCDELVRSYQETANIKISYPSGVFGPDDPKLNESNEALITFVRSLVPRTSTGIQCVDVRDVAKAHLFMLEQASENARYIIGGHYYPWESFHALLEGVTGGNISSPKIPGNLFRGIGKVLDLAKLVYPLDTPIGSEAMEIVTQLTPANSSRYLEEANAQFLSGETTFSDTIKWLVEAGHLEKRFAPELFKT
jgi:nucleoside-diphosphate-sugar epimerase